jgi:hypothetical protein
MAAYAGQLDGMMLQVICDEPGPWNREELLREFSSRTEASDALGRLVSRGLVLKMESGFVVASAAGRYAHSMSEEAE